MFGSFVGAIAYHLGLIPFFGFVLVAFISMLIDLDHYISYYFFHRKDMAFKRIWNECILGHFHGRSFIHRGEGFLLVTLLLIGVYFLDPTWFFILGLSYYNHYFLDHIHLHMKKGLKNVKRGFHFQIFYLELAMGIVVKILTFILILY